MTNAGGVSVMTDPSFSFLYSRLSGLIGVALSALPGTHPLLCLPCLSKHAHPHPTRINRSDGDCTAPYA